MRSGHPSTKVTFLCNAWTLHLNLHELSNAGKSYCSGSSDTPQIPSTRVCHDLHIICHDLHIICTSLSKITPANQAQLSPKAERLVDPWTHGRVVASAFSLLAKKDLEDFEALHENWRTHSTSLDKNYSTLWCQQTWEWKMDHRNNEIGDFPIRTSIYRGFSIAMFDDRRISTALFSASAATPASPGVCFWYKGKVKSGSNRLFQISD